MGSIAWCIAPGAWHFALCTLRFALCTLRAPRSASGGLRVALSLLVVAAALTSCTSAALAQRPRPPQIEPPRIGFAGRAKLNVWTPVEITVRGGDQKLAAQVELAAPDGDGVSFRVPAGEGRPIQILPNQTTSTIGYVKIGRFDSDLVVRLTAEGRELARADFPLAGSDDFFGLESHQELILTVGSPVGVELLPAAAETIGRGEVVNLPSAALLPTQWYGLEGVDWLILTTSRPDAYAALVGNTARQAALRQWVHQGGKLVLCVGKQAPTVCRPDEPLAAFVPGKFRELATLTSGGPLETYAEAGGRLDAEGEGRLQLQVPVLDDVRGVVEAAAPGLPLVVRSPFGFGEVVFVGLDLDQPPLNTWAARRNFTNRLLDRPRAESATAENQGAVYTLGYQDLAGQLRAGLDQFVGVQPVSFGLVALLIIIYIALIGPGDYFLVKRILRRMELTWVTFPLWVLSFSLLAYGLAYWLKGDKLRVNRAEVVDVDVASGQARGAYWANVFSPRIDAFNVSLQPELPSTGPVDGAQVVLSWLGLPGRALAGRGGAGWFGSDYRAAPALDALAGLPIAVWSTKGVEARWSAAVTPRVSGELSSRGLAGDVELSGSLTNGLDEPLEDCVLLHGRWAYPLGQIGAGERISLERRDPQTLETYFKRIRSEAGGVVMSRYDRSAADVGQTLEMMMFHRAVGGHAYTGLANAYGGQLDFSRQLQLGRAVLLCKAAAGGSQLLRDGQPLVGGGDQTWTYYRFLLPVEPKSASAELQ